MSSLDEMKKKAEAGDAEAQVSLGCMYRNKYINKYIMPRNNGTIHNKATEQGNSGGRLIRLLYNEEREAATKAAKWFTKAAEQGNAKAQNYLGVMYDYGEGVQQDYAEAVRWYRKAAQQGYDWAQYNLALKYFNGQGVTRDGAKFFEWFIKAAQQGLAEAQFFLSTLYADKYCVNIPEAFKWLCKSAEGGYDEAQYLLGIAYVYRTVDRKIIKGIYQGSFFLDIGNRQDRSKGVEWLIKAAKNGNNDAKKALNDLGEDW